jgi:hypothetical protein
LYLITTKRLLLNTHKERDENSSGTSPTAKHS